MTDAAVFVPSRFYGPVQLVRQRWDDDCAIAAVATITDRPYPYVWSWFSNRTGDRFGLAIEYVKWWTRLPPDVRYSREQTDGIWPPRPFAQRHLALVENDRCGHLVVMDSEGVVLDPLDGGSKALTAWKAVNIVAGFGAIP